MTNRHLFLRLSTVAFLACVLPPALARAQSAPAPPPPAKSAIGEDYLIEVAAGAWATEPSSVHYSDTENGVVGTNIDFKQQLGLSNQRFLEFHLVARPAPKQKFRADFIPLNYQQTATLTTNVNYAGQAFPSGDTVSSALRWDMWRGTYEYDAIIGRRGYVGGMVGLNDVVVDGTLANGSVSAASNVQIPMPGLGAIARFYPWGRLSITGEAMGFDLPGSSAHTHGHASDLNAYATLNLWKSVALEGGYRTVNVNYSFAMSQNTGAFTIRGPYIVGVVRY